MNHTRDTRAAGALRKMAAAAARDGRAGDARDGRKGDAAIDQAAAQIALHGGHRRVVCVHVMRAAADGQPLRRVGRDGLAGPGGGLRVQDAAAHAAHGLVLQRPERGLHGTRHAQALGLGLVDGAQHGLAAQRSDDARALVVPDAGKVVRPHKRQQPRVLAGQAQLLGELGQTPRFAGKLEVVCKLDVILLEGGHHAARRNVNDDIADDAAARPQQAASQAAQEEADPGKQRDPHGRGHARDHPVCAGVGHGAQDFLQLELAHAGDGERNQRECILRGAGRILGIEARDDLAQLAVHRRLDLLDVRRHGLENTKLAQLLACDRQPRHVGGALVLHQRVHLLGVQLLVVRREQLLDDGPADIDWQRLDSLLAEVRVVQVCRQRIDTALIGCDDDAEVALAALGQPARQARVVGGHQRLEAID
eukprot:m.21656 g.21656  ORF g.21656 m.21656 type:complete len:421 (-) comp3651_c0_seq1:1813-3075(-)